MSGQSLPKCNVSCLPGKLIRGVHHFLPPVVGEHAFFTQKDLAAAPLSGPKFIIRVDDFPAYRIGTDGFRRFHEHFRPYDFTYIIGITPSLGSGGGDEYAYTDADFGMLHQVHQDGVEFALHGFTHRAGKDRFHYDCELSLYSDDQLVEQLGQAANWFREHELTVPDHFIPPFNTFSQRDYSIISRFCRIVHGGPLSLTTFGKFVPGYDKAVHALYLPSYEPFYGRAESIHSCLAHHVPRFRRAMLYVITLHWWWEIEDDFSHLAKLLAYLRDNDFVLRGPWDFSTLRAFLVDEKEL